MLTYLNRPWVLSQCRKRTRCRLCEAEILVKQPIYRPLREGPFVQRYHRMCQPCGDRVGTPLKPKEGS